MKLKPGETLVRIQYFRYGKKIDIIKNESEKEIWIHKEELEEGQFTNSKIIQTKDSINLLETTKKGTNSTDQSKVSSQN